MEYFLVDSFTRTPGRGNPAGVVLADQALEPDAMQRLAGELGRESAFLWQDDSDVDYRVAYYTGVGRVPLCGHDTIAAITVLAETGRLARPDQIRFSTDVGLIDGEASEDGTAWMTQALPTFGKTAGTDETADALGLESGQIAGGCVVVSTGTPFLFVPIKSADALHAVSPRMERLSALAQSAEAFGAYLWTLDQNSRPPQVFARCFAPGIGLPEDPVTGSAGGALGTYLLHEGLAQPTGTGVFELRVEQGRAMGRPGTALVRIEASQGAIASVRVGGHAVIVSRGVLDG